MICSEGEGAQVFDITTEEWQLLYTVFTHGGDAVGCAYNQDGSLLAGTSRDGTTRIWDAETGQERMTLFGISIDAKYPSFSPDGKHLIVSGDDLTQIYMLHLEELVALAKSRVTRSLTDLECQEYLHMDACPEES